MKQLAAISVICLGVGLNAGAAEAGPCAGQIAQLETSLRQSGGVVAVEPSAPESLDAKLHHQPTPSSIDHARQAAQSTVDDLLAQAKVLDAKGEARECHQAVDDAKLMLMDR